MGILPRQVERKSAARAWPDGILERIARMVTEQRFPSAGPPGVARGAYEVVHAEGAVRGYREASAAAPLVIRGTDATARLRGLGDVTIWLEAGAVRYRLGLGALHRALARMFGLLFGVLAALFVLGLVTAHAARPGLALLGFAALYGAMTALVFAYTVHLQVREACEAIERTLLRAAEDPALKPSSGGAPGPEIVR